MLRHHALPLLGTLVTSLAVVLCAAACRTESDVSALSIRGRDPSAPVDRSHWSRAGFTELVPAIRPPSTPDLADRIEVWVKLPEGALIQLRNGALVMPPGAVLDRVESIAPASGGRPWVADVRGTELGEGGAEAFHVYRRGGLNLYGFSWSRASAAAARAAADRLAEALVASGEDADTVGRLRALNDCASCHQHDKREAVAAASDLPRRAADATGFYVPSAVLRDRAPLEGSRPWDPNLEDPYMRFHCASGEPLRRERLGRYRYLECPGGEPPQAELDMTAALAAGDEHALSVCRSRLFLARSLDDSAHRLYAREIDECSPK